MTKPHFSMVTVDATSQNLWYANSGEPARVKNVGPNTVYIGAINPNDTAIVNTNGKSYPLAPGESVVIPGSEQYDSVWTGFNTVSGTSQVRIISTNP